MTTVYQLEQDLELAKQEGAVIINRDGVSQGEVDDAAAKIKGLEKELAAAKLLEARETPRRPPRRTDGPPRRTDGPPRRTDGPPRRTDGPCGFYMRNGWCKYGEKCQFSHDAGGGPPASGRGPPASLADLQALCGIVQNHGRDQASLIGVVETQAAQLQELRDLCQRNDQAVAIRNDRMTSLENRLAKIERSHVDLKMRTVVNMEEQEYLWGNVKEQKQEHDLRLGKLEGGGLVSRTAKEAKSRAKAACLALFSPGKHHDYVMRQMEETRDNTLSTRPRSSDGPLRPSVPVGRLNPDSFARTGTSGFDAVDAPTDQLVELVRAQRREMMAQRR